MGFAGKIYPVGREPGVVYGKEIITDPWSLPQGIDLAVILVPAKVVPETLDICGEKGILHAIISTGGFKEYSHQENQVEKDLISAATRNGIRFIGPNCVGAICTHSGLCTPFNPLQTKRFKRGPVSLIIQSGGVTTQAAYYFLMSGRLMLITGMKRVSIVGRLSPNKRERKKERKIGCLLIYWPILGHNLFSCRHYNCRCRCRCHYRCQSRSCFGRCHYRCSYHHFRRLHDVYKHMHYLLLWLMLLLLLQ